MSLCEILCRQAIYLLHTCSSYKVVSMDMEIFFSQIFSLICNLFDIIFFYITDFGVVCLLFDDPEQIFLECWNREKTVGSLRRSQKCFPHPHFDKPIPDPTENVPSAANKSMTQYLHLKKSFYDAIRDPNFGWQRLPICKSILKLRLENTKVKGSLISKNLFAFLEDPNFHRV